MQAAAATAAELAAKIHLQNEWIFILCGMIGAMAWAIWWVCGRLADGCPRCPHCAADRADREKREREINDKYSATAGLWKPKAPSNTAEETRERLFGRQVIAEEDVPPEPGPSGDEDGGAGHADAKDG